MTEELRKFGPKPEGHPPGECLACDHPFAVGDYTTLIVLGPGGDSEGRRKARQGVAYNAVAVEVHWACATGEEDP